MKYERRHIEEIKRLAIELHKDLSVQPLNIRAKISSIANLAEVCLSKAPTRPGTRCRVCKCLDIHAPWCSAGHGVVNPSGG